MKLGKVIVCNVTKKMVEKEMVSNRAILTSWGEGASLALVGHPSSDGVSKKMPYGVDVFIDQLCTPSSYWVG